MALEKKVKPNEMSDESNVTDMAKWKAKREAHEESLVEKVQGLIDAGELDSKHAETYVGVAGQVEGYGDVVESMYSSLKGDVGFTDTLKTKDQVWEGLVDFFSKQAGIVDKKGNPNYRQLTGQAKIDAENAMTQVLEDHGFRTVWDIRTLLKPYKEITEETLADVYRQIGARKAGTDLQRRLAQFEGDESFEENAKDGGTHHRYFNEVAKHFDKYEEVTPGKKITDLPEIFNRIASTEYEKKRRAEQRYAM